MKLCLILNFLYSAGNNFISYTRDSTVEVKCTGYFETSHPVGKYRLKYLTNSVIMSPGQCNDYRSQIVSYKSLN